MNTYNTVETVSKRVQRGLVATAFLVAYTLSAVAPFVTAQAAYAENAPPVDVQQLVPPDPQELKPEVPANENVPEDPGKPEGLPDNKPDVTPPVNENKPENPGKPEGLTENEPQNDKIHKSYICKYVSKPGEAERLQTGDNPIYTDNHSLVGKDEEVAVGDEFSDEHTRSVVIVANTPKLDPEPGVGMCPPARQQPPMPEQYDPCGLENDTYTIPAVAGVTYKVDNQAVTPGEHSTEGELTVTVKAHAEKGSGYTEHNSWTLTFTNLDCNTPVVKQKPGQLCVPGPNNDIVTFPQIAHVTYKESGWKNDKNKVTATTDEGYYFQGTEGKTKAKWILVDENTDCGGGGESSPVVATEPTVAVVCGPNNDTVTLPVVAHVTYEQTGWVNGKNTVTAMAHEGYYFQDTEGETELTWELTDENTSCGEVLGETTPPPAAPTVLGGGSGAALQDTGNDMLLPMLLSTGILGLAIMAMLQNSPSRRRPSRLAAFFQRRANELQAAFAQPFTTAL